MTLAQLEPTTPAGQRQSNHALDRAATGFGRRIIYSIIIMGRTAEQRDLTQGAPPLSFKMRASVTQQACDEFDFVDTNECTA
jgi:hypothetical protein